MDKIGKLLFLHFEKILVALFGLGLLYSIIFYGPWIGRADFSERLQAAANKLNSRPVRGEEAVPEAPDLVAEIRAAGEVPQQASLEGPVIWPEEKLSIVKDVDFLPPVNANAEGDRGFNVIKWEINPNQPELPETLSPLGAEVERALVTDGLPGPFESITRSSEGPFMGPKDLYALVNRFAPIVIEKSRSERPTIGSTAPYTIDDLFNALHDGYVTPDDVRRLVRGGVLKGWFTAEDQMNAYENLRDIPLVVRDVRQEYRDTGEQAPERTELFKKALELMGYRGGGKYRPAMSGPITVSQTTPTENKPAEVVGVVFEDVTSFVDADVNPDLEYVYRVRFWTADTAGTDRTPKATEWSEETNFVAPKPDTEFHLLGINVDMGIASVLVRKWVPSSDRWYETTYQISPGEQIGRVEMMDRTDSAGNFVYDPMGNRRREPIDFSTDCVLLEIRYRPRSFERTRTVPEVDPETQQKSFVDMVDRVLYDTPQIVYSDRKGRLRLMWRSLPQIG